MTALTKTQAISKYAVVTFDFWQRKINKELINKGKINEADLINEIKRISKNPKNQGGDRRSAEFKNSKLLKKITKQEAIAKYEVVNQNFWARKINKNLIDVKTYPATINEADLIREIERNSKNLKTQGGDRRSASYKNSKKRTLETLEFDTSVDNTNSSSPSPKKRKLQFSMSLCFYAISQIHIF